jgi:hypothetical protein
MVIQRMQLPHILLFCHSDDRNAPKVGNILTENQDASFIKFFVVSVLFFPKLKRKLSIVIFPQTEKVTYAIGVLK